MKQVLVRAMMGTSLLAGAAMMYGCVERVHDRPVYVEEPAPQPGPPPGPVYEGDEVEVDEGPPVHEDVIVGARPGPDFYWVNGYYFRRGHHWEWRGGYWGRAPRAGVVWHEHRWVNEGGHWRFHAGFWG